MPRPTKKEKKAPYQLSIRDISQEVYDAIEKSGMTKQNFITRAINEKIDKDGLKSK